METNAAGLYQSNRICSIAIERIAPNPSQPRRRFDQGQLQALSESIRRHGLLQPLSVQKTDRGYVLVAGERRLRAAGMAGLTHVPCIVVRATERDSAVLALVENLQRQDLDFMEESEAIAGLITRYGLSQQEAARRLGLSQPAVANKLRLLHLSGQCVELLRRYGLTERHARALLRLPEESDRLAVVQRAGEKQLTVAATEAYIEELLQKEPPRAAAKPPAYIIKDVRLFLNSVAHGMDAIRRAGVDARYDKRETDDEIVISIQIPKRR